MSRLHERMVQSRSRIARASNDERRRRQRKVRLRKRGEADEGGTRWRRHGCGTLQYAAAGRKAAEHALLFPYDQ